MRCIPKIRVADGSPHDTCAEAYSEIYSESYFDVLYTDNSDPWQYMTRWYEKRKRDICLAILPQVQYGNAIELGCGNGVFSELLSHRCQALVDVDGNHHAVQLATARLADYAHVSVVQGVIPEVLSTLKDSTAHSPPFDLIVISEILYYLSSDSLDTVITWIGKNLTIGGTLLCCHWRYAIDGFAMTGEAVHQRLHDAFNLVTDAAEVNNATEVNTERGYQVAFNPPPAFTHQSQVIDTDFLLDVWQHSPNSVAMQENLV